MIEPMRILRGDWPLATSPRSRSPLPLPSRPDRVLTMLALSERLPDRFIAETFAQTLRAETGGSVLLIHLDRPGVKATLGDWAKLQPMVNGEFAMARHVEQTEGGIGILRVQVTDEADQAQWIPSLVAHCSQHFHYLILRVSLDLPMPAL